ncbi:monocarboxylate transporter 12-like, partial [Lingula anatina]|uniref:Monocarboxylate transporter 12-like n=1 Tax=Lingula anatina TaxID=7574 RepID=A0A1S3HIU7_LINAN
MTTPKAFDNTAYENSSEDDNFPDKPADIIQEPEIQREIEEAKSSEPTCIFKLLALTGSTLAFILIGGIFFNSGVLYVTFLEHFGADRGVTAWAGSVQLAMVFGAGPAAAALANRFNCYVAVISGGLLATLGLIISSFATDIYFLISSYGFMTGIGLGLVYAPAVMLMGKVFTTRRGLAVGIVVSGMSSGWLSYPFIMRSLLDNCGWQICLRVLAAMTFVICICGVCMIPAERKTSNTTKRGLDIKIIRNPNLLLLCLAMMAYLFGLSVVSVHVPAFGETLGFSVQQGSMLATIMGATSLLGRIFFGAIADVKKCDILVANAIAVTCTGIPVMLYITSNSYAMLASFVGTYGFFSASFPTYVPLLVLEFVGIDKMVSGKGIAMF